MSTSSSGQCLICSTPTHSIHFGIESCRACANFFKRTKLTGRKYPCRQSDGKCNINRDEPFLCRGCRYDRCLNLGMQYESPSDDQNTALAIQAAPSTSESLLERIRREHDACTVRRHERELEILRWFNGAKRVSHPKKEIYTSHFEFVLGTLHVTVAESRKFFRSVFPAIADFSVVEQLELFRWYFPMINAIDCCYRTQEMWGGYHKYSMSSVLMCVDLTNPERWIRSDGNTRNRALIANTVRVYVQEHLSLLLPSCERMSITETEMHALLALALSECDPRTDVSVRVQQLFDSTRIAVLRELQRWYKQKMGLNDCSTRLGNLFTLLHTIREGNVLFQEFFRSQIALFDLYSSETMIQELYL